MKIPAHRINTGRIRGDRFGVYLTGWEFFALVAILVVAIAALAWALAERDKITAAVTACEQRNGTPCVVVVAPEVKRHGE